MKFCMSKQELMIGKAHAEQGKYSLQLSQPDETEENTSEMMAIWTNSTGTQTTNTVARPRGPSLGTLVIHSSPIKRIISNSMRIIYILTSFKMLCA